jgi:catechol 2,3-dioxygenase-like lactoylglutathione lyase family enzyme
MAVIVESLDHLVINVTDLARSADWYRRVLGVQPLPPADGGPPTTFAFGRQALRLRPVSTSQQAWFTAARATAGSDDLCFLTRSGPAEIVAHLESCGVAVELGPVPRQGAQGAMISVYCRDPDGSLIEIATREG